MKINWQDLKVKIIKMYSEGKSTRAIAEFLSEQGLQMSHVTVNKWLSRWGVERRNGKNRRGKLLKDLSGKRFGSFLVIRQDTTRYPTTWICECDCGRTISVEGKHLCHDLYPREHCGCKSRKKD